MRLNLYTCEEINFFSDNKNKILLNCRFRCHCGCISKNAAILFALKEEQNYYEIIRNL